MKKGLKTFVSFIAVLLIIVSTIDPVSSKAATKLSKPANFKGKAIITKEWMTELTATWSKVKGADGYQVYYRETSADAEGKWESWSLYQKTKKTTVKIGIIDGEFQVRVRAYKGSSHSDFTKTITVLGGEGIVQNSDKLVNTVAVNTNLELNQDIKITSFAIDPFAEELNLDGTNLNYTYNGWSPGEGLVKAYAVNNNGKQAIIESTVEGPGKLYFKYGIGMEIDDPNINSKNSPSGVSKINFYIDDTLSDLSDEYEIGEAGNSDYECKLSSGTHKLKWIYSYSGSANDPYVSYAFLSDLEYQQSESYKVTFDGNGNGDKSYEVSVSEDETIDMKTPVRDGYSFEEWNVKYDGSGVAYDSNSDFNRNVTLYAIWKKKPEVKISATSLQIYKNGTANLTLNNAEQKVTWKSNNNKIATVSSLGKVTGISEGKVTITAESGGKSYSCKVTVKKVTSKILYNQLLEKGVYTYKYYQITNKMQLNYFYYMDLNNDGVKELIVSAKNKAVEDEFRYLYKEQTLIFTVKNSKLVYLGFIQSCIDDKGLMYNKKYKGIIAEPDAGSGGRGYGYEIYKIQKNKLKCTNECDWHYETLPYKNYYVINNKNTTKAKYSAYLKKYFNKSDYTHFSLHNNTKTNRSKYIK